MFKIDVSIPEEPFLTVKTTENRGFTPDEVAERCVESAWFSLHRPPLDTAQVSDG